MNDPRHRKLIEMRERLKERLATPSKMVAPNPPPRYDDVYFEGMAMLDDTAQGEASHQATEPAPAPSDQCECRLCKQARNIRSIVQRRDPDEMAQLIVRLEDSNYHLGFDLEYYESIFNGSWPNAVELLEAALQRARERKSQQEATHANSTPDSSSTP